ncbi:hypothetical protein K7432_017749 [Basidiobolus ranarum]|uniref:Nudix hydrolase domain-containing protein n=1 Tax=Basidiobolus ranarum TaxID=34480 RepID=A0ABR2VL24_9FUNG
MTSVSLLSIVALCDKVPYEEKEYLANRKVLPFSLHGVTIGYVDEPTVLELKKYVTAFGENSFSIDSETVTFHQSVDTFEERSEAVMKLLKYWKENGTFACLKGWRNEFYPVYGDSRQPSNIAFRMERAGCSIFGFRTFGAHLNGYVRTDEGIKMWVARRSLKKPTWPGLLDNIVAGGISYGQAPDETIVKECDEEANIPMEIAAKVAASLFI